MAIATINPATGALVQEFTPHDAAAVDGALARAAVAAARWRRRTPADRAALLLRLGELLDEYREPLARLATLEMGKTVRSARDEVAKCAFAARWYAAEAPRLLAAEEYADGEFRGAVHYQPLGVVLAVMPWNFPFWQVLRAAIPAIAAGNAMVLKHASNVPQCAVAVETLFRDAGAPDGLFVTLLVGAGAIPGIIADSRVSAVTLTGSDAAGRAVASEAGRHAKKCVLELGGSDPFVVLDDADVAKAAEVGVTARMINNGQSCVCAKRFIVHERVATAFEAAFVSRVKALRVGDPALDTTDVGPLATRQGRDDVAGQVERSTAAGARVVAGGRPGTGAGWFYEPTVLSDVPRDCAAVREEVFGPVAPILRVASDDEAIALANDTPYGLGASVWTGDRARAERFVYEIDAGMVFVNAMVASDPRIAFGGVKASGYGREVGVHGLREFTNAKTVRGSTNG